MCIGAKAEMFAYLFGMAQAITSSTFKCKAEYTRPDQPVFGIDQCKVDIARSGAKVLVVFDQAYALYLKTKKNYADQLEHSIRSNSLDLAAGIAWTTQLAIQSIGGCSSNDWKRDCTVEGMEIGTWMLMTSAATDRYADYCRDIYNKNGARKGLAGIVQGLVAPVLDPLAGIVDAVVEPVLDPLEDAVQGIAEPGLDPQTDEVVRQPGEVVVVGRILEG